MSGKRVLPCSAFAKESRAAECGNLPYLGGGQRRILEAPHRAARAEPVAGVAGQPEARGGLAQSRRELRELGDGRRGGVGRLERLAADLLENLHVAGDVLCRVSLLTC